MFETTASIPSNHYVGAEPSSVDSSTTLRMDGLPSRWRWICALNVLVGNDTEREWIHEQRSPWETSGKPRNDAKLLASDGCCLFDQSGRVLVRSRGEMGGKQSIDEGTRKTQKKDIR